MGAKSRGTKSKKSGNRRLYARFPAEMHQAFNSKVAAAGQKPSEYIRALVAEDLRNSLTTLR